MKIILLLLVSLYSIAAIPQKQLITSGKIPYWEIDATPGTKKPIAIYLHGYRGFYNGKWTLPISLDQIKNQGPMALNADGSLKYPDPPFVIVCPLLSSGTYTNEWIDTVIAYCLQTYPVSDIYLFGWSYGGGAVWEYISQSNPTYIIKGAVPIAGGYNDTSKASNVKCKVWAFHGNADDVVPMSKTQLMYDALTCEKRLTIFEANHNISPWPFNTTGFWEGKPYTEERMVNLYSWLYNPIPSNANSQIKRLYVNGVEIGAWPFSDSLKIEVK